MSSGRTLYREVLVSFWCSYSAVESNMVSVVQLLPVDSQVCIVYAMLFHTIASSRLVGRQTSISKFPNYPITGITRVYLLN